MRTQRLFGALSLAVALAAGVSAVLPVAPAEAAVTSPNYVGRGSTTVWCLATTHQPVFQFDVVSDVTVSQSYWYPSSTQTVYAFVDYRYYYSTGWSSWAPMKGYAAVVPVGSSGSWTEWGPAPMRSGYYQMRVRYAWTQADGTLKFSTPDAPRYLDQRGLTTTYCKL